MAALNILLIFLAVAKHCETANILYVTPFTSKSHNILLKPIGLELARRGHNVTVITGHREQSPPQNYRQVMVDMKEIWDIIDTSLCCRTWVNFDPLSFKQAFLTAIKTSLTFLGESRPNVFDMVGLSAEKFHKRILWTGGLAFSELVLNSSQVKEFLAEDIKFDLVISEQFFQESLNILAYKYNTPLVLVTTFGNCMRHNIVTRNPLQLSTVISEFLDVRNPFSFWGRLRNLYFTMYEYIYWKYWYLTEQEKLVTKYFPELPKQVPSLYELQKNASLILINGHFSFDTPLALHPNIVEVGGIHLTKSTTKLPKDLQKVLDNAKHGVIYVSFGSNVRSSELPDEKRNAVLNVFRKLNQTVLWKWEDDNLKNKPDNLFIRKWLPQKEILSHPNIKIFIAHGGLIGTQEAIFHGVPIVGVPIYADQYNKLLQTENVGFGKILEYNDINEETLYKTIQHVLTNETYMKKAKEISARFRDRPMNALDTAMFWIEYVIRNNGATYMKNPAIELSWVAYNMIDCYVFILIIVIVALYLILKIPMILISCMKMNQGETQKKKVA